MANYSVDDLIEALNTMHDNGETSGERYKTIEGELIRRVDEMPFDEALKALGKIK